MPDKWIVKVVSYKDDKVIKELSASSERQAYKIDDGLNINLNHEEYYTVVEQKSPKPNKDQ